MPRYFYCEKTVEAIIKKYPRYFLDEELLLLEQQPRIYDYKPDLIFKDVCGNIVIVEIQTGELDKAHIYRTLEYRDLYLNKYLKPNIRILLFCETIKAKHKIILKTHNIEYKMLVKKDFIKKVKEIEPKSSFIISEYCKKLTAWDILRMIEAVNKNNKINIDAYVFYKQQGEYISNFNLRDIFWHKKTYYKYYHEFGSNWSFKLPLEIIVSKNIFDSVSTGRLSRIGVVLEFLTKCGLYPRIDNQTMTLGPRASYSDYEYESYLDGRRKILNTFFNVFYNTAKAKTWEEIIKILKTDTEYLQNIRFFSGKYPDYKEEKIFGECIIEKYLRNTKAEYHNEEAKNKDDRIFYDITFKNFDAEFAQEILRLINHINHSHVLEDNKIDISKKCHQCLIPPKDFSNIPRSVLRLTSKYFVNYQKTSQIES